jgi:hypothetical protein
MGTRSCPHLKPGLGERELRLDLGHCFALHRNQLLSLQDDEIRLGDFKSEVMVYPPQLLC